MFKNYLQNKGKHLQRTSSVPFPSPAPTSQGIDKIRSQLDGKWHGQEKVKWMLAGVVWEDVDRARGVES